jgi:DNA-nicking Smr family endonuclease
MKGSEWSFTPFKGLKDALKKNKFTLTNDNVSAQKISRKKSDDEIFREAMADVKEIKEFRKITPKKPPKFRQPPTGKDNSLEILREIIQGERKINLSDTGEYIEWINPKIRKDISEKLHHGHFSVQDYIDLHGMTLSEAEEAFSSFFRGALNKKLFCVKVIHGRGLRSPNGPVLKQAFIRWLKGSYRKHVLAYSTAKDCDGGLGATYILLKS